MCQSPHITLKNRKREFLFQAKTQLGWEPKVALRDGLRRMVQDFTERLEVEMPAKAKPVSSLAGT